jgi:competence protein ComFC
MRSWTAFQGPIRNALHKLKYRRYIGLGDALAKPMVNFIDTLEWQVDLIIPVPLGKKRLRERGYNQASLIAQPLAAIMQWKYLPGALTRIKETRSQVGLTVDERKENVAEAFLADETAAGRNVLIFDDVATTGATISSCASALKKAGADMIYGLTVARAMPHSELS